jgi:hypothetical protein
MRNISETSAKDLGCRWLAQTNAVISKFDTVSRQDCYARSQYGLTCRLAYSWARISPTDQVAGAFILRGMMESWFKLSAVTQFPEMLHHIEYSEIQDEFKLARTFSAEATWADVIARLEADTLAIQQRASEISVQVRRYDTFQIAQKVELEHFYSDYRILCWFAHATTRAFGEKPDPLLNLDRVFLTICGSASVTILTYLNQQTAVRDLAEEVAFVLQSIQRAMQRESSNLRAMP